MTGLMKPNFSSFSEIKRNLDPDSSYIIFERNVISGEGAHFQEIIPVLSRFEKGVLDKQMYHDKTGECVLLVVKLDSGEMDRIIDAFLTTKMPMNVNFYIYGARRNGRHSMDLKVLKRKDGGPANIEKTV